MADTEFETTYIIRAQDEATQIFKGIGKQWDQMAADAKAATDQMNGATSRHGQEINKLTQFYREQRSEHRLHSFLFRESRDAIGAAALALTGFNAAGSQGSEEMKKLNAGLQQGFITFQGLDFALAGLGAGPWGIAIAGIAGLAAAFAAFNSESSKAADEGVKKFLDSINQFANMDFSQALSKARKAVADADEAMSKNVKFVLSPSGSFSEQKVADEALQKQLQRKKELAQSFISILEENINKQNLWNEITEYGNNLIEQREKGILAEIDAQQEVRKRTLLTLTDESEILTLNKQIAEVDAYRKTLLGGQADNAGRLFDYMEKMKELDIIFIDNEQKKRMEEAFKFFEFLSQSQSTRQAMVQENMDAWLRQQLQGTGVEALKQRKVPDAVTADQSAKLNEMEKAWERFEITQERINDLMVSSFDSGIDQMVSAMYDGTVSMDKAFKEMAKNILVELTAMIAKALIWKLIMFGVDLITGGAGTVVTEIPSFTKAGGGLMEPTPQLSRMGGGGSIVNVNLTVQAMDARSVREWAAKTETRDVIVGTFRDAWEKGKF